MNAIFNSERLSPRIALIRWALLAAGILFVVGAPILAAPPAGSESADDTGSANTAIDADNLDSLLKAADEDVSQLAKVSVASPALAEEVTTVSRQESTVGRSAAAVFVVTNEMIRRSGARTIPDVLRMVPGVNVASIDANKWAVSIRGSNGRFANKLLVQIDGRTVYTPLYGGVFWDVQDLVFEDIERIEVIRGPGATVWESNAVNGIINIITKNSADTQGAYAQVGSGTEELGFASARYGNQIGKDAHYRLYGKWFERGPGYSPTGDAHDAWRMGRGGFRADWTPNVRDTLMFQGEYYKGSDGEMTPYASLTPPFTQDTLVEQLPRGGHGLFRWRRELDEDSDWTVQMYYDRTERSWSEFGLAEDRDTFDFDFQHRFPLGRRHSIIWGFGYRNSKDDIRNSDLSIGDIPLTSFDPSKRSDDLFGYFIQDEITLKEDLLYFTIGSKFEHNDYTGFEFQPTTRLLWTPTPRHSIWGSISRAVRTPTRAEEDLNVVLSPVGVLPPGLPVFIDVVGNHDMLAEEVMSYEAGVRVQPTDKLFWDLAVFFNDYKKIRGINLNPYPVYNPQGFYLIDGRVDNSSAFQSYGFEIASTYDVHEQWRVRAAYSFLIQTRNVGGDMAAPRNQIYLQSSWDLRRSLHLDMIWRYVDSLAGFEMYGAVLPGSPSYNVMDIRLAWDARPGMEVAVVGRNLLDLAHYEAPSDSYLGTVHTEVPASVYGMVTWRY